jgi:peptide methionine sulfoxide reductase msrA/msrB
MKTIFFIGLTILIGLVLLGFHYTKIQAQTENAGKDKTYDETKLNKATFAGGCFWCTESDFEKIDGVVEAISGYTGGEEKNPTYGKVSSGMTGHTEAVQVLYDPEKVSYADLLEVFWRIMDPTDAGGQFVDRGLQYRPAIFYHDEMQRLLAEKSRQKLEQSGRFDKPVATEIVALGQFYPAEAYHQDYYKKSAMRYKFYRFGSGRDQFLSKVWGNEGMSAKDEKPASSGDKKFSKPEDEILKQKLTSLQYKVTQKEGTAPNRRSTMNTGTIKSRESMWTLFPESLYSAHRINMIPKQGGPASPNHWRPATSWNAKFVYGAHRG